MRIGCELSSMVWLRQRVLPKLAMHRSPRLWIGLVLVFLVVAIASLRIGRQRHAPSVTPSTVAPPARSSISDRSISNPLNQPGGGPAPEGTYAIYSSLYQDPVGEPLVFAEDSATDIPQLNGSCLQPSTAEERELTAAFESANRQSHRWEQKFTISQPYQMLTRVQASQAQTCLDTHFQDASRCDRYRQIRHVRFLGVPGIDSAHEHALVSVVKMCGSFCGSGGIFEVEKSGSIWRRTAASDFTCNCSWTYWK